MSTIISILQDRITQKISEFEQMEDNLQEKLAIVADLTENVKKMVGSSGSSAQERRKVKSLDLEESIAQHQQQIADIRSAITECEEEIKQLEEQKKDMEKIDIE